MAKYKIALADGTVLYEGNDPHEADLATDLIYTDGHMATLAPDFGPDRWSLVQIPATILL